MGLRDRIKGILGRTGAPAPMAKPVPGVARVPAAAPPVAPPVAPLAAPAGKAEFPAAAEPLPWYLQNDTDGWDATNPGTEPETKNLTK